MNIRVNPFIVSGHIPAEYFCDRQEEAARLQQFLMNQQNVVLTAARRMGKTTPISAHFCHFDIETCIVNGRGSLTKNVE